MNLAQNFIAGRVEIRPVTCYNSGKELGSNCLCRTKGAAAAKQQAAYFSDSLSHRESCFP